MTIKLAISGAAGRMGRRLLALSDADRDFELAQAVEWDGFPDLGKKINAKEPLAPRAAEVTWSAGLQPGADVVIDFSSPASVAQNAKVAADSGARLIVGTTGLDEGLAALLRAASEKTAVLFAPNFSLGVNLMFRLAAEAARILGDDYNIEIVEAHHNQKVDAPSGTALGLARAVADELGRDLSADLVNGRSGKPGKRTVKEIGMHALRMGSVTGDHRIYFCSDSERIEIAHHAESRDVFVTGALRAAKWIVDKAPGFYSMQDMLFGGK